MDKNALLSKLRPALTYLLLLISLVSTILLICSCIPLSPGGPSSLASFYAVRINLPGQPSTSHGIQIGSFALCATTDKETHCAKSGGKSSAKDIVPILYKSGNGVDGGPSNEAIDTALLLQHNVFYGTACLGSFFIVCSLVAALAGQFIAATLPKRMKKIAAGFAALGAAVMLVDGFSSTLVFAALKIASKAAGSSGFLYQSGITWMAAQWTAFGASLLAAGLLGFEARDLGKE